MSPRTDMEVLVFKTNVNGRREVGRIKTLLLTLPTVREWNVDLEDCDRVLRIVADKLTASSVEKLLQHAGFNCLELKD